MIEQRNLLEITARFGISRDAQITRFGNGHIHETYEVLEPSHHLILQKINSNVFHDCDGLMRNITLVTDHMRRKLAECGENPDTGTLTVIRTVDGQPYYRAPDGDCYRVYLFIDGDSRDQPTAPALREAGAAFGRFQNMLADFDVSRLTETISHFHDTPMRLQALENAAAADICGRLAQCRELLVTARRYAWLSTQVTEALAATTVPLRVTHNDTKLNNLLFARGENRVLAVIDLDTVMPGSLLYDFGDSLRCGMSMAAEDERNTSEIGVIIPHYEAFTRGFVAETGKTMTPREAELLPLSALLMTYECGIRFLTDYLAGDTYFHIAYNDHNLVRARNQLVLTERMEEALPRLKAITKEIIHENLHI